MEERYIGVSFLVTLQHSDKHFELHSAHGYTTYALYCTATGTNVRAGSRPI
jgi:hypothetical protein